MACRLSCKKGSETLHSNKCQQAIFKGIQLRERAMRLRRLRKRINQLGRIKSVLKSHSGDVSSRLDSKTQKDSSEYSGNY